MIEPQAQVIYQGVQQDDFTAANHARVSQSQGDDIQTRLGLHSEWRTAVHVIPTLDLNYYHDPHATEIEEDGSTISDDGVKQRGEIKWESRAISVSECPCAAAWRGRKGVMILPRRQGFCR